MLNFWIFWLPTISYSKQCWILSGSSYLSTFWTVCWSYTFILPTYVFAYSVQNTLSGDLPLRPTTLSNPLPKYLTPSLWQWWIWQQDSVNDIGPRGHGGRTSRTAFAFPFITPAFITARRVPDLIKVRANEGGAGKKNTGQKLGTKPN